MQILKKTTNEREYKVVINAIIVCEKVGYKMQISPPPPPLYDNPVSLHGHASHKCPVIYGIFA